MLKYFKESDFACKCGCGGLPEEDLMRLVDRIREEFGHPVRVSSGYRCPKRNKAIGGAPASKHISGKAADLMPVSPANAAKFRTFIELSAQRLGYWYEDLKKTPTWVHVQSVPYGSWVEGKERRFDP